jgi:hypothetical protein
MESVYNDFAGRNTQVSCSIGGNGPSFIIIVIYLNSGDLSVDLSFSIYFLQNSSLFLEEVDW